MYVLLLNLRAMYRIYPELTQDHFNAFFNPLGGLVYDGLHG